MYIRKSPSHTGLTTMLRPSCDLKMLESWEDRMLISRLVAEVVGDRGRSCEQNQSQQGVQNL